MGAAGSLLEPMHYECDACSTMYIPDEPRDPRCPRCGNNGHHQHALTNVNHTAHTIAGEIYDHYHHHHHHYLQQDRQLPPWLLEQQVRHDNPVGRSETRDFSANISSHGINPQLLFFLNSEAFRQRNHRGARREGGGGGGGAISSSSLSSPFGEGVGAFDAMQLRAALQNSLAESNEMKTNPASTEAIRCLDRHTVQRSDKESMAHATTDGDAERSKTDVCVICSEVPRVGEVITTMPCKHSFHDQCLRTWLKQQNTCPICRYVISAEEKKTPLAGSRMERTISLTTGVLPHTRERIERGENVSNSRRGEAISLERQNQRAGPGRPGAHQVHVVPLATLHNVSRRQILSQRQQHQPASSSSSSSSSSSPSLSLTGTNESSNSRNGNPMLSSSATSRGYTVRSHQTQHTNNGARRHPGMRTTFTIGIQ